MRTIFGALFALLGMVAPSAAADRYFVSGGGGAWNSTSSWSTTSGGSGGSSVPGGSDAVFLDANSPSATVTGGTQSAASLNCTGYTNTLTFNNDLQVGGAVTLSSSMTMAGSSFLWVTSTSTFTSNGKAVNTPLRFTGNVTITLGDALVSSGGLTIGQSFGQTITMNSNSVTVNGSLTVSDTFTGTSTLTFGGTGTWSGSSQMRLTATINTAGTLTISGTPSYSTGTLTYTAGTISAGSSTLNLSTCTLDLNGATLANMKIGPGTTTVTNNSDFALSGTLTLEGFGQSVTVNGGVISIGGGLSLSNAVSASGTAAYVLNGTGTFTSNNSGAVLNNDLEIDTAGTITISVLPRRTAGTMTYTAGTLAGRLAVAGGGGGSGEHAYTFVH